MDLQTFFCKITDYAIQNISVATANHFVSAWIKLMDNPCSTFQSNVQHLLISMLPNGYLPQGTLRTRRLAARRSAFNQGLSCPAARAVLKQTFNFFFSPFIDLIPLQGYTLKTIDRVVVCGELPAHVWYIGKNNHLVQGYLENTQFICRQSCNLTTRVVDNKTYKCVSKEDVTCFFFRHHV